MLSTSTMPRRCILKCPFEPGVTYHIFPSLEQKPERFKAWVQAIGGKLDTPEDYDYYRKQRICDRHFPDVCKNRNNRVGALGVPSLHLNDDPAINEEMGSLKIAPKEMLETRVIRAAKRRTQDVGDEPKKIAQFSGCKAQPTHGNNDNYASSSKADSTVNDSPFKIQTVTSSTDKNSDSTKSSLALFTSSKLKIPSTNANVAKSLFVTSEVQNTFGITSKLESNPKETEKKSEDTKNDKKLKYYLKLKDLNESVLDWIKKIIEQTPLCILTPVFKNYDKYLKEIQDEYEISDKEEVNKNTTGNTKTQFGNITTRPAPTTVNNMAGPSILNVSQSSKSLFAMQSTAASTKSSGTFSFEIGTSTNTSSTVTTSSAGYSFGAITSSTASTTTSSPTSFVTTTSTTARFSFGIGKTFSSNSKPKENTDTTEETSTKEDASPKVEFTPVVEDNTVYNKCCKVLVMDNSYFADKGVGTLYIKKIEEIGKHQLLIRANTNLRTILVNLILLSAIPAQRMGKNYVMLVCVPTPKSKPPSTPILIRVKTVEEADELLETINKYKT